MAGYGQKTQFCSKIPIVPLVARLQMKEVGWRPCFVPGYRWPDRTVARASTPICELRPWGKEGSRQRLFRDCLVSETQCVPPIVMMPVHWAGYTLATLWDPECAILLSWLVLGRGSSIIVQGLVLICAKIVPLSPQSINICRPTLAHSTCPILFAR